VILGKAISVFDPKQRFSNHKSLKLDSGEYVVTDNLVSLVSGYTTGTLGIWIKPTDATPASNQIILSYADTDGADRFLLGMQAGGEIIASLTAGGVNQWAGKTDTPPLSDGVWSHVKITQDGVQPVIEVNEVAVAQSNTSATDLTKWLNDTTGIDNGRIGCISVNSSGNVQFFDGNVDEFVVDSEVITGLYNNGKPKNEITDELFRFGDHPSDNFDGDVAGEWRFYGKNLTIETEVSELVDVVEDVP